MAVIKYVNMFFNVWFCWIYRVIVKVPFCHYIFFIQVWERDTDVKIPKLYINILYIYTNLPKCTQIGPKNLQVRLRSKTTWNENPMYSRHTVRSFLVLWYYEKTQRHLHESNFGFTNSHGQCLMIGKRISAWFHS